MKTDEKKEARTSAFPLSVVADNSMLSSKYVRSHIPDLVLVLDRTYDQRLLSSSQIPFEHGVLPIELDCAIYNSLSKCPYHYV